MKNVAAVLFSLLLFACSGGGGGQSGPPVSTTPSLELLAGDPNTSGRVDAQGAAARFNRIADVATDRSGIVYVTDSAFPSAIRKITADGTVSTIAGGVPAPRATDGFGPAASFDSAGRLTVGADGNLYVADTITIGGGSGVVFHFSSLRMVTPEGQVTTFIITNGLEDVNGLAADPQGNVYVSSGACAQLPPPSPRTCFSRVERIAPDGTRETLAATPGSGGNAPFLVAGSIALDGQGDVFVLGMGPGPSTIYKISADGTIAAVAGTAGVGSLDGPVAVAQFNRPQDIAADSNGNIYVADTGNHTIRKISGGIVTTIAGVPGQIGFAPGPLPGLLNAPARMALDAANLYIAMPTAVAVVRNRP